MKVAKKHIYNRNQVTLDYYPSANPVRVKICFVVTIQSIGWIILVGDRSIMGPTELVQHDNIKYTINH